MSEQAAPGGAAADGGAAPAASPATAPVLPPAAPVATLGQRSAAWVASKLVPRGEIKLRPWKEKLLSGLDGTGTVVEIGVRVKLLLCLLLPLLLQHLVRHTAGNALPAQLGRRAHCALPPRGPHHPTPTPTPHTPHVQASAPAATVCITEAWGGW